VTVLSHVIERFAARTGMVIVRPLGSTPWYPKVSCLLANTVFLLYLREMSEDPEALHFSDDVPKLSRWFVTMLAPTFGPEHWFTLTDVIREQDGEWGPHWSPSFPRTIEGHLEEVERRFEHLRDSFSPENFLEFSTRVRSGLLTMRGRG